MSILPLQDYLLIEPSQGETQSKGGIYLPDTAQEKASKGKIIALGPGRKNTEGKSLGFDVKVGDLVLWGDYAGEEIELRGQSYFLVKEEDLLGFFTP